LEVNVLKYFSFPFGVSIFCIARRSEQFDGNQSFNFK
jgi:hypothetical protein